MIGRPSIYNPSFCETVVEYGKAGKSITWIAAELGVVKQTIYTWMECHPDFMDAMTLAKQFSQQWWEDAGQCGMDSGLPFNASIWSRSMAARFPDDWREVKGNEISGPNGSPLQTQTILKAENLTNEQLRALASIQVPTE